MIKAGIFDVGNVLIHWDGKNLRNDITTSLGISEDEFKKAWHMFEPQLDRQEITEDEFWKKFKEYTNTSASNPSESLLTRQFIKLFSPFNEMIELSRFIKKQGLKNAILSNTMEAHASVLKEKGIYEGYDVVILSNEVGLRKPDQQIYKLTLQMLEVLPDEAFFIDDLPENINAANEVGIHGIQIESYEQVINDLKKLGVPTP